MQKKEIQHKKAYNCLDSVGSLEQMLYEMSGEYPSPFTYFRPCLTSDDTRGRPSKLERIN